MIKAVSNNALIAALFGPGVVRPSRFTSVGTAGQTSDTRRADGAPAPGKPVDSVEISTAGRNAVAVAHDATVPAGADQSAPSAAGPRSTDSSLRTEQSAVSSVGGEQSDAEAKEIRKLKQRDAEVRRHEQAHKAAAGAHATGGPTFEFTTGPDGRRYAVGGEVNIDTSEVPGDPQATIAKMQQIRRAATAPAQPSSQDRAVAAQAAATERKARTELAEERRAGTAATGQGDGPSRTSPPGSNSRAADPGALLDLTI